MVGMMKRMTTKLDGDILDHPLLRGVCKKKNGDGWFWDETNDHQVGWGDQPSHVGTQKMNGDGWFYNGKFGKMQARRL
jgi:hypothetical protein